MNNPNYLAHTDHLEDKIDNAIRGLISLKNRFHETKFTTDDKNELIQIAAMMINLSNSLSENSQALVGITSQQ